MTGTGFEVNTDSAFINPDWEMFAENHDRRYGLAIQYVKSTVKGKSFDNSAMSLRVGAGGFYTQSQNFPAAFYGDTGECSKEVIGADEAQATVFDAVALYRAGDARSITCIYSDSTPPDVYFGYRLPENERYEMGFLRASLPLHLRVMIEGDETRELLGDTCGVLIYQQLPNGQHLVVRAPGRRQPFLLLDGFDD